MDAQKEFFLKQIEQLHQNNKIRGSQDYMNYIGNNYDFLIQLVREQETQLSKYERVVKAAKHYREVFSGKSKWYEIKFREEAIGMLKNAVDELEEST